MTTGTHENPDYSLLGEDHVRRYRETDGEVGYWWNGAPTLLLTTTGRRSGKRRTSPLIFGRDGDDYLVVASVGGMPDHPAWYLNLGDDPNARIQVRGEHIDVVARTADADEKARLWGIVNEVWPNYEAYQQRTDRVIPVVVLSPR
ncbi:MAG: nitroreductase family deazaflavin-dependent oxidoreductase [Acidimicrobiia bacterium]|nr:nitroreductase family deazaflavin-dependent oxidoreductase [Acidimicrobiia bacterium]